MALSLKSVSCKAAPTPRAARQVVLPSRVSRVQQRNVRVFAENESTPAPADESVQKLQTMATDAVTFVKEKWDATDNSEKPAAVAIIVGAVIAQIAIGATVDAVDKIPIVNRVLQLVGVAVTGLFGYRYFTDPAERELVKKSIDGFLKGVTGDK